MIRYLLAVALLLVAATAAAMKTDVIVMDNGNVLVGEIKFLEYGILELSMTDIKGRVRVEWKHVVRVTSKKTLHLQTQQGTHIYGSLLEPTADGELRVMTPYGELPVVLGNVVVMEPIKPTAWERFSGDLSTGLSYTKATDILQFNFGGSMAYRTERTLTLLRLSSIITAQSGGSRTNTDVPLAFYRYFERMWFWLVEAGGSRNDELGIDFRGNLAGGAGRRLIHSNSGLLQVSIATSVNREFTSDDRRSNNFELVLKTLAKAWRYDTPKLEFSLDLGLFANLTVAGRYRVNLDGRLSLELFEDFFWDVSQIYYRYDTDPSQAAASRDDWGIISGLRYKWH